MATILVIDDESGVRITLKAMLEMQGHSVLLAEDGLVGINKMTRHIDMIDLVITDIMMPGANGLTVINKARDLNDSLPVIAISGGGNKLDFDPLQAAIENDVSAVLRKPFNSDELNSVLNEALS